LPVSRLRAAESVSRADSANCPLPRPIRSPKSVPDTVFPSRRAECRDTYPALFYLTEKVRVIECRDRLQWILQCCRSVCPNSWGGWRHFNDAHYCEHLQDFLLRQRTPHHRSRLRAILVVQTGKRDEARHPQRPRGDHQRETDVPARLPTCCAGQTVRPSLHSISQTSVGKLSMFDVLSLRLDPILMLRGSGEAIPSEPPSLARPMW
jgi:hypothetical protein